MSSSTTLWVLSYCLASSSMLLVNSFALTSLRLPFFVVLFQMLATVILLYASTSWMRLTITPLRRSLVNRWLPILLCFLLMLTTSAASLVHVTPVSVIVWRNINLLTVALGEFVLYGTSQGVTSVIALVVVAIGSIAFAYEDLVSQDVDSSGIGIAYFALVINTLATTGYNLYNKSSFRPRLDPISSVFYNNALSILPMVALTATFEGRAPMAFMRSPAWDALLHLVLSGLIGFAISWTGFELQSRVSATGFTVATNVNKVLSLATSFVFLKGRQLSLLSWLGLALSLAGAFVYSQLGVRRSKKKTI